MLKRENPGGLEVSGKREKKKLQQNHVFMLSFF